VPPPPVSGAPAGTGLADRVTVTVGDATTVAVAVGVGVGVVGTSLGEVLSGELLPVAEPLDPGENVGGDAEGEDPEQAATEAEANMATAAQLTAVTLVLSPVPVVPFMCILVGSPHAPGRARMATVGADKQMARSLLEY
jgi:hypothetical protein